MDSCYDRNPSDGLFIINDKRNTFAFLYSKLEGDEMKFYFFQSMKRYANNFIQN